MHTKLDLCTYGIMCETLFAYEVNTEGIYYIPSLTAFNS